MVREYPQFDGLRAVAVGLVAYHHWIHDRFAGAWYVVQVGSFGVQIFFVLSGFLITEILQKNVATGNIGHMFRAFYIRRALRIFPVYYLTIAVLTIFAVPPFPELFWWNALYAGSYIFLYQDSLGIVGHFWTLAMEEQFYLVWPAIVVLLAARLWIASLVIVVSGFAFAISMILFFPHTQNLFNAPIVGMDALAIGAVLSARGETAQRIVFVSAPIAIIWAALNISGLVRDGVFGHYGGIAAAIVLVYGAVSGWKGWFGYLLEHPWARKVGVISYGIYIYHAFTGIFVAQWLNIPFPGNGIIQLIAKIALTLLVAYASWKLIEAPINSLKRHFPYQPEKAAQPAAV